MGAEKLSKAYLWLADEPGPKMLVESLKLLGTAETVGKVHNPLILAWAKDLGLEKVYTADEIPWCGLVHAYICKMAGKAPQADPLWAQNWAKWGVPLKEPELGCTVVFKRPGGGHVGLYVGEDAKCYHILGGNQGNAHSITRIPKERAVAFRNPEYTSKPANIRKVILSATGAVSTNEA
jgi:uncharacterized protein (TIGR02594 family)